MLKQLSLKARFGLGAGITLFLFCLCCAVVVYRVEKQRVEEAVYKEAEIYIAAVDATRTYVKDVLRPKMYQIVPDDHFVVEAMSTSFVGREIMGRIHERFKNFRYRRTAIYPINPESLVDSYEREMIGRFGSDRSSAEWSGLIERDGQSYYARFRAIVAEAACLRCHGRPEDTPQPIIETYGKRENKPYLVNTVVGVDAVYVPVGVAFQRIKARAWGTFVVSTGLLSLLVLMMYSLFNFMVASELKGLVETFRQIIRRDKHDKTSKEQNPGDEIDQLKHAFERVADDLGKAHNELSASEWKFRILFENSRDPIFISDMNMKVVDINSAGIALFGFVDKDEARSIETIEQMFWDARDAKKIFAIIKRDGFVKDYEVSMVNRYGDRLDIMATLNLRMDDHGESSGYEGVLRDITKKKQFDKQMARTEKLAAIGQFAAGVAHEINNPLGVIECYSTLIAKSVKKGSQEFKDAEIIKKHTANSQKIVEGLLRFARVGNTKREKADIHAGIEDVLGILEPQMRKMGIEVKRDYEKNMADPVIDEDKMKQVYMNLLMNANQAIKDKGTIGIRTFMNAGQDGVVVEISDTGIGIPLEAQDRIFDPFFTTKGVGKGTGLGLSISYGIINEHGGIIKVYSKEQQGSVFTIELPLEYGGPVS